LIVGGERKERVDKKEDVRQKDQDGGARMK